MRRNVNVDFISQIYPTILSCPAMARERHTFYMPELSEEAMQTLSGDEAQHAIRVMRLQADAPIRLVDGHGHEALASVVELRKRDFDFRLEKYGRSALDVPRFHLAIAPTKNMDRLEWCLEKCTEIGLARISPLLCQNSERRKLRIDRLERIAIAAMKQSGAAYLPQVDALQAFEEFVKERAPSSDLRIAHCREEERVELRASEQEVCVLIGPEGDFSQEEIALALRSGAKPVHLGAKRLRTETAAVVACTLMNLR